MTVPVNAQALKQALVATRRPTDGDDCDYRIATAVGPTFLARSRSDAPTLLIPLDEVPGGIGRRGGGFVLNPAERVLFHADGERWEQPAATLECTEGALLDTFLVLVTDVAQRASAAQSLSWPAISGWVEEWQVLLAHRIPMDMERQLGLWGELWVIAQSNDPDTLIAAWRGPENSATDFFVGGVALEVKTSRGSHTHFVSQKQLDSPAGAATAYVLSLWVDIDPAEGRSLADLVDGLLSRVSEPAAFLKQVAQLGYVPADCAQYMSRLALLDVPLWFPLDAVPRVRAADPGVSQLRYKITLDADKAVSADVADSLWTHFGHHQKALL